MNKKKAKNAFQNALLTTVGLLVVGYFVYHTILGDRGWFAMRRLENEVAQAQGNLDTLQKERTALQHRTQLLQSNGMDPDLLEEKSRELLNYSKPNEIVILTSTGKR